MSIPSDPTPINPQTPAQYAARYRQLGLQVMPSHGKVPALAWKEFQDALISQDMFDGLYGPGGRFFAHADMGMVTGKASSAIIMLDMDTYKSTPSPATAWWDTIMEVHNFGFDLETWEQVTGGGGKQLFFQCPDGWMVNNASTDLDIDIRGQGGFTVLPPSMHASGRRYRWRDDHAPWEIEITLAPQWLMDEIERLVAEHGGVTPSVPSGQKPDYTGPSHTSFGTIIDGRERYMRDLIYAALIGYRVDAPIMPGKIEKEAVWADYLRNVAVQLPQPGETLPDGLEREGRGRSLFDQKWAYLLKQWDTKVAEAAKVRIARGPKPADHTPQPKTDPKTGEILPLIQTAEQFMRGYVPPNYQVDGILQKGYLYALTARTGHGKTAVAMLMASCIARGVPFHGHPTEPGKVLFLAGENPQDVRVRYRVLADREQFSPEGIPFHFVDGVIDIAAAMPKIREEAVKIGDLALIVVDTATAYFRGDDANSNTQQGMFAQLLRQLIKLPGAPAVVVNCHPVKNASQDNLIPLGGSNFLNEIDGNFTLWADDKVCALNPHPAKWRGAQFEQMEFELQVSVSDTVKDAKGRHMPSVVAVPITEQGAERNAATAMADDITLLKLIHAYKNASVAELAKQAGFIMADGKPYKSKVSRIIERLKVSKAVYKYHGSKHRLTKKGCKMAGVKWEQDDENE